MAATLNGDAFSLARWFQPERYANRPEDDFLREEILNDLYHAQAVAVQGDSTLVRTPLGACCIEPHPQQEGLLVFDYVSNERWERTSFWMNRSSVRDLGDVLRAASRADYDAIFVGAI